MSLRSRQGGVPGVLGAGAALQPSLSILCAAPAVLMLFPSFPLINPVPVRLLLA